MVSAPAIPYQGLEHHEESDRMDATHSAVSVGTALRRARKARGLTLEAAARQAEVTKGYLSKVEQGQAMPSIRVITRLADVCGVPLSDILMPDDQRKPISLVRSHERIPVAKTGGEIDYVFELASRGKANPHAEIYFLTLPADAGKEPPRSTHPGEEVILVISGRARFRYAGVDFILDAGDCLQFDASIEHHAVAEGKEPAQLFVVRIADRN
jgi:transcriptional regulator with XRE-family HTH domain